MMRNDRRVEFLKRHTFHPRFLGAVIGAGLAFIVLGIYDFAARSHAASIGIVPVGVILLTFGVTTFRRRFGREKERDSAWLSALRRVGKDRKGPNAAECRDRPR
jgi:uncharacterized membrane protein HdeD (DUF308 family)